MSLWQALFGVHPFAGQTFEAIRRAVVTGAVEPMPPRAMPRRILRALRRGISVRANQRFPDMHALLDQLTPRRRIWIAVVAAAAMIGGGALAATLLATPAHDPCKGVDGAMDDVWPARREAVHEVAQQFQIPEAAAVADAVVRRLDERADRWRTMRLDTCEANRVRRTEDDAIASRRTRCLDRSLLDMRAAVELLTGAVTRPESLNVLRIVRAGQMPEDCSAESAPTSSQTTEVPPEIARRVSEAGRPQGCQRRSLHRRARRPARQGRRGRRRHRRRGAGLVRSRDHQPRPPDRDLARRGSSFDWNDNWLLGT